MRAGCAGGCMVNKFPLVSVMIPFYNTPSAFLVEAIESVLGQTYAHWELLLVDDGSTNLASSEVAQTYVATHPNKIRYLMHPGHVNRGLGPSRQLALSEAQGELVAFLDADDLWLPHKLTEQVALMIEHLEVGAIYGRTKYWYSWSDNPEEARRDYFPPIGQLKEMILPPPELLILFIQQQVAIPCMCSIMVRRTILEAIGGFEKGVHDFYYEDQMLYIKICQFVSVLVSDQCWDYYRQHSDSGTYKTGDTYLQLHRGYLDWLESYFEQDRVTNVRVWRTLRRQQWLYRQPKLLPARFYHFARFVKKWLLRLAAKLPTPIQQKLWCD